MRARNLDRRNFGLGSRDLLKSIFEAYKLAGNGFCSNAQAFSKLGKFATYIEDEFGIKDLRKIQQEHVQAYAEYLKDRFEQGLVGGDSIRNDLTTVNVALREARLDLHCHVKPSSVGFPAKNGIAVKDISVSREEHNVMKSSVELRLAIQLDLQRHFGLRIKESSLIDAKSALKEALKEGHINIKYGSKGGRPRAIPILSNLQIKVLEAAAEIQGNAYSLIPSDMSWKQYQGYCYRQLPRGGFHGERHHYANERYENLTGVHSPLRAGIKHDEHHAYISSQLGISLDAARELDLNSRFIVAEELGHGRASITNNYLG